MPHFCMLHEKLTSNRCCYNIIDSPFKAFTSISVAAMDHNVFTLQHVVSVFYFVFSLQEGVNPSDYEQQVSHVAVGKASKANNCLQVKLKTDFVTK